MPVFHIEEKITLNTWDDIINRSCYESPVEPRQARYGRIAAVYSFKDKNARCGLSDCLRAHGQGFLIITSDEKEANLCEACGLRFFDVGIEAQKKTIHDEALIREQKIRLNTVLEHDVVKARINKLKQAPKGANWLYRVLTSFRKTYPADLLAALTELATNKDENTLLADLAENEAGSSQLEHDSRDGGVRATPGTVAEVELLQGLGIFAADIREELIGKILKPLTELEELAGDPDANPSLTRYCKWAESLEKQFACAEYLIEEGRAFFDTENLERLKSIPLPEVSARLVQSLRWDCNKAAAKRR